MSEAVLSAPVKGRSLWDDAGRRLMRNRAAVASMVVLGVLVLLAVVGPSAGSTCQLVTFVPKT